jgi:hypothetical protein
MDKNAPWFRYCIVLAIIWIFGTIISFAQPNAHIIEEVSALTVLVGIIYVLRH